MNRLKYFTYLLGIALLFNACSSDDEATSPDVTDWEGAELGLFGDDAREIKVPDAMAMSSDPHAMSATSYVTSSTMFGVYGYLFQMPEGATQRSTPITASNGRMQADSYMVYEWGTDTASIAYQFYEEGGQQFFEIFIGSAAKGYFKWMEAIQSLDGKQGTMKWFEEEGEAMVWTWEIMSDDSYHLNFSSDGMSYEVVSNKDFSGSVNFYENGVLQAEMSWDSAGNGVWREYEGGNLVDEGEWTV